MFLNNALRIDASCMVEFVAVVALVADVAVVAIVIDKKGKMAKIPLWFRSLFLLRRKANLPTNIRS